MPSLILISQDHPRQVFELGRATLMVGRDDNSTILVSDVSVSRNHASIVFENTEYVVHDNGSTNGTYVNGERVSRHVLQHHDIISFGSCLFLVDMGTARRGPRGTEVMTVTHVGSKDGKVVEISPKPTMGEPVRPVKLILSSSKIRRSKSKPPPPFTAR